LIYERATSLLEAELGDELVGLEPGAGICFGFNDVAKRVWQLLEQPRSFEAVKAVLLDEYDVAPDKCGAELRELLADFADKKLIIAH
jgi:hypothetical protein